MPVAPAPTRNQTAASVATNLVWVRMAKPAETTLVQTRSREPLGAFRLALARARADPQHLGRRDALRDREAGESTTSARRSGTEKSTPRMPPVPVIAAVVQ